MANLPAFAGFAAQVAGVTDKEQTSTILYKGRPVQPIIGSWMNGEPKAAPGVGQTGGMFIAQDNLQGVTSIPGWVPYTFVNRENKHIPGLACGNFYAILVRQRMRWLTKDKNDRRPPRSKYSEGYNSNSHLLMLLPGLDFPVVLAGHGQAFTEAIDMLMKDREAAVGGILATLEQQLRAAGANNPDAPLFDMMRCAFQTHLTAANREMKASKADASKSSGVTPIKAVFPEGAGQEYLDQMFVGGDMINVVKDLYLASEDWAKEWEYTDAIEPLGAPIPGGYVAPTPAHMAAPTQQPYVPPTPPTAPNFAAPPAATAPATLPDVAAGAYGGVTPPLAGQYATPAAPPQAPQFTPPVGAAPQPQFAAPGQPQFAAQPQAPQFAPPPAAAAEVSTAPTGATWTQAPPLNLPPAQGSAGRVDANGNVIPF